jgi:CheY-like chemotaxis protein
MNNPKPVLYAEDDENDVYLMERTFGKLKIPNPLRIAADGKLAIAYLAGTAPFQNRADNPLPCLMLMDLSMPGRHGLDVLAWMKNEPDLSQVPVVVFSSSNQESDISRAYSLGASGFVIKPGDPKELIVLVQTLQQYWLSESRPPGSFTEFAARHVVPPPNPVSA